MPSRFPLLRLPLLVVLLALSGLLLAGAAHATPLLPSPAPLAFEEELEAEEDEGEEEGEETSCEEAEEEFEEGELDATEMKEICEEEKSSDREIATHPQHSKAKHHRHKHKKACGHKRHCSHRKQDRQGGGFNSRAHGGATGQAGRRAPTNE